MIVGHLKKMNLYHLNGNKLEIIPIIIFTYNIKINFYNKRNSKIFILIENCLKKKSPYTKKRLFLNVKKLLAEPLKSICKNLNAFWLTTYFKCSFLSGKFNKKKKKIYLTFEAEKES